MFTFLEDHSKRLGTARVHAYWDFGTVYEGGELYENLKRPLP